MQNFIYQNETKVFFGTDSEDHIGEETAKLGKRVLLHYGGGSVKKYGLYDKVIEELKAHNMEIVEFGGAKPNPVLSLVQEGIDLARKEKIDCILAIGGGSAIDSAKAIGIGVPYEGNVWDFYAGIKEPETMLPLGVVLTLPAAGSETSPSSVITNEDGMRKNGLTSMVTRPDFCILNPERTITLPDYQTACGVSDMLAHTMERYFTNDQYVELTDRLCEGTMKTIINQGLRVRLKPRDYNVRAEIMWCGTIAHGDILHTGRTGDWGSHQIEHELSAYNDVAHGAGLSVVFPAWMKYVSREKPEKFKQFATRVFDIQPDVYYEDELVMAGIEALEDFYQAMGLPIRLSEIDIDASAIADMAEKATAGDTRELGNFKKLKQKDVLEILKLAL